MPDWPLLIPLLFGGGLAAGLVDSIAGGGGLITVPLLMAIVPDPRLALGTNKLQSTFGSFTAMLNYARNGQIRFQGTLWGIFCTLLGAAAGTVCVQHLGQDLLKRLIPVALLAILVYTAVSPRLGVKDIRPRMSGWAYYLLFGLGLGFYDGFFGPGTGSFWTMAFMVGLGHNMQRAVGHTKLMNFTSNVASLIFFLLGGNVVVRLGLIMAAGEIVGARIGSGMVLRRGVRFVRPVFLAVVLLTVLYLLWQNYRR